VRDEACIPSLASQRAVERLDQAIVHRLAGTTEISTGHDSSRPRQSSAREVNLTRHTQSTGSSTRPPGTLGTKYVDLGGITSPASATAMTWSTRVGLSSTVVRQGSLGIPYGMQLTGAWVTAQSPTSISYLYPGDARFLIHTHPLAGTRAPGPPGSIYSWGPSGVNSAQAKVAFARVGSLQGYIVASRDSLVMLDRNMGLSTCATPP